MASGATWRASWGQLNEKARVVASSAQARLVVGLSTHTGCCSFKTGAGAVMVPPTACNVGMVGALHLKGAHVWVGGENGVALRQGNRFVAVDGIDGLRVSRVSQASLNWTTATLWLNAATGLFRIPAAEIAQLLTMPGYRVRYERLEQPGWIAERQRAGALSGAVLDRGGRRPPVDIDHRRRVPARPFDTAKTRACGAGADTRARPAGASAASLARDAPGGRHHGPARSITRRWRWLCRSAWRFDTGSMASMRGWQQVGARRAAVLQQSGAGRLPLQRASHQLQRRLERASQHAGLQHRPHHSCRAGGSRPRARCRLLGGVLAAVSPPHAQPRASSRGAAGGTDPGARAYRARIARHACCSRCRA
jgi:hypothetical protein